MPRATTGEFTAVLLFSITAVSMEYFISEALFTSSHTQTNSQQKAKQNKTIRLALATSVMLRMLWLF